MKKINLIVLFLFIISLKTSTEALTYGGCEYSEISKLKSYVSNINLSYNYRIVDNQAYFDIVLSNIVPGIYFVDSETGITYTYNSSYDGEVVIKDKLNGRNGVFKFYSENSNCYGTKLGDKYYNLPTYNIYHTDSLCVDNPNSKFCKKWREITFSYDELKKALEEKEISGIEDEEISDEIIIYEATLLDSFVRFYVDYYYIILVLIILICISIMILDKKKNRFDI